MGIIWWLIVGLIAGWLTGKFMGGGGGVLTDIIVGLIGALAGGFLMSLLYLAVWLVIGPLWWLAIGYI